MKKFLLILSCISFLFMYNLCSEADIYQGEEQNHLEQETIVKLKNFNDSIIVSSSSSLKSGFWRKFKNAVIVASADGVGAAAGVYLSKEVAAVAGLASGGTGAVVVMSVAGAVCGVGASFAAYDALPQCQAVLDEDKVYSDFVALDKPTTDVKYILDFPERYSYLNTIGAMHNNVIEEGLKAFDIPILKNGINPGGETPVLTDPPLETAYEGNRVYLDEGYIEREQLLMETPEISDIYNEISNNVSESYMDGLFDMNIFIDKMGNFSINEKEIYNLFYGILLDSAKNMTDVIYIANNYISIIEDSNLNEEEKEKIFLNIAVAVNSISLWNNILSD